MNKITRTGMVAGLALATVFASAQGIGVQVNGQPVLFPVQQPEYMNGRVMVPLRGVFEKLGAFVTWHPETDTVQAVKGDTDVRVRIGSHIAEVNGSQKQLDVAPILVNGTTLVPLRFLSESLGAQVDWSNQTRLVTIVTGNRVAVNESYDNRAQREVRRERRAERMANAIVFERNSVLPVTLNTHLNSETSQVGDRFSATIDTSDRNTYVGLPVGTRVEGTVITARPRRTGEPGILELGFDRMRLPDGRIEPLQGSLISLDSSSVQTNADGTLVARPSSQNNRLVYAGYGAGAGLLVGVLTKRPLEGALIGGLLGYIVGSNQRPSGRPSDVDLQPGTRFGVRLDERMAVNFNR